MTAPAFLGSITLLDGAVVLAFTGELDLATAPEARTIAAQAHEKAAAEAGKRLVIDLRAVTFLASVGLELLADHRSRAEHTGVTIALVATTRTVTRVLEVTGLDTRFTTYADVETAVAGRLS
ncbi:STAS domain-containing protein [Amycolatopsis sp. WQ 127309]|uniref:STAS domain-containing protein n=1 Tax=Amycolatopsis sp. WQ 127309 TaxID=2932773 RepID=UPI001FF65845|nr:STAS domain-containing protein [Amycolatopsis sp. WQ 127309]UOZ02655.1 STAS domain-containing protein [Amycolatopsis sp. WQ 127309]